MFPSANLFLVLILVQAWSGTSQSNLVCDGDLEQSALKRTIKANEYQNVATKYDYVSNN